MNHKILLIDDSPAVHELVRSCLVGEQAVVGSAFDGESGVALAVASIPDLILVDVDMPGIDGFEVCRRLNDDVATSHIPVVFLTAVGESFHKVRGLNLGGSDYITKPFEPAELAARVRAVLRAKTKVDSMRAKRVDHFIRRSMQSLSGKSGT